MATENYGGLGPDRQNEIYLHGLLGQKPGFPTSPEDLEQRAKAKMTPEAYDYVSGGAGVGSTMKANLEAFQKWRIVPRMLKDVSQRDLKVTLLGKTLPAPVLLGPVGVLSLAHPDGDLAVARAASSLGLPYVLSNASSHSIEEVAGVMGTSPRWFQLYFGRDRDVNASFLRRAESSGYDAVVVTLDTKILGWRDRDLQNGFLPFLKGEGVANFMTDPVFRGKLPRPPEEDMQGAIIESIGRALDPAFGWDDIGFIRDHTRLPIVLKGVLSPEDAEKALSLHADGIVVSNHGGRQVDGGISSLSALPQVVETVGNKIPVFFDSGIRTGADAVKALALGANAVLLGRLYTWALAVGGEDGVREVVRNFLAEMDLTLALSGVSSLSEIDSAMVTRDS
ncbi:MAG: lactate 2-monooxygenase [Nitrososphaerota archaeon]|nr:lactate 2-monooxygenase [Nitrososphaerota archaeon]